MSDEATTSRVLIPCSDDECWAVPQSCLAEIHVVNSDQETPPQSIEWRGREVPVVDFGSDAATRWCERRVGTGLVAIFLGMEGAECEYWGVAIRGAGLDLVKLDPDELLDASEDAKAHASAAFRYNDVLYQVPDLDGLQQRAAAQAAV